MLCRCVVLKMRLVDPSKCKSYTFRLAHVFDYLTDIKMTPEEVEAQIRSFY